MHCCAVRQPRKRLDVLVVVGRWWTVLLDELLEMGRVCTEHLGRHLVVLSSHPRLSLAIFFHVFMFRGRRRWLGFRRHLSQAEPDGDGVRSTRKHRVILRSVP